MRGHTRNGRICAVTESPAYDCGSLLVKIAESSGKIVARLLDGGKLPNFAMRFLVQNFAISR
jgi:hypothetical protein